MDVTQPMEDNKLLHVAGVKHVKGGFEFVPLMLEIALSRSDKDGWVEVTFIIRDNDGNLIAPHATEEVPNPWELFVQLEEVDVLLQVAKHELVYRTRGRFFVDDVDRFTYELEKPLVAGGK